MERDRNEEQDSSTNGAAERAATRPDSGWAHYAEVVSKAQGYQLDEAQLARVVAQLELISTIAAPLLALQLPAETEPAPVFRP